MWKKSLAFCGGLSLILLLDPSLAPAQPGGKGGGKGGFGKGGDTGGGGNPFGGGGGNRPGGGGNPFGGGNTGGNPFGGGNPGGGGNPFGGGNPGGGGNPFGGGMQPGGGGMGGPGGGGMGKGGGRGMDPERQWSMMVNLTGSTGDTIDLSKIPAQTRPFLTSMAERSGTQPLPESGVWTKAQFVEFAAKNEELRAAKAASGGTGGPGGGFGNPGGFGGGNNGWGGGGNNGWGGGNGGWGGGGNQNGDATEQAQRRIREQDKDGDGKVSFEEADSRLRERFRDIDANGDGYIDAQEYAGYYAARSGGGPGGWGQGGWGPNGQFERQKVEEERPVAMRYGKLPGGLPNWYDELDTDKDGQVSLYEWRLGKKTITEFNTIDLNGDGLITADEYLRFSRQSKIDEKVNAYLESDGAVRPTSWGVGAPVDPKTEPKGKGPGGWGGFPGGGPGGWGKGDNTKGGDTPSMKGGERPEGKGKNKDGEGKKNPWSKGG